MDTIGQGTGDVAGKHRVSVGADDEQTFEPLPPVTLRGLFTPRSQVVLIAVGIGLFNAVLIGLLFWLIFTH